MQWKSFAITIAQADLAAHNAVVSEVHSDGVNLLVAPRQEG